MTRETSVFLYGTLRHEPLLKVVLGRMPDGVSATLEDHRVMAVDGASYPAIAEVEGGAAEGLLVTVSAQERARLDFYEAPYRYGLKPVTVLTEEGRRKAELFFPKVALPVSGHPWELGAWVDRYGAATTVAAAEVMALMGVMAGEEVKARYGSILTRAHSRIRAGASAAPVDVRRGPGAEAVEVNAARRPYTEFFAVAESELRFQRFDGGQSRKVTRAAFLMGDAVTVLPYDPVRDRVMLIEQFRFGPYMRGDPNPWSLEPIAGRIDPGEGPEDAARREAVEEGGLTLGTLHGVGSHYPSPGAVTEYLWSYVALADLPDEAARLGGVADEEEDILGHVLPFAQLMELIASGEAENGPLILSAYWLALNRDRLRGEQH